MDEFLKGLSQEDAIAAINDQMAFGTAMVHEVNGIKRRIPPSEWVLIDKDEGKDVLPTSDRTD